MAADSHPRADRAMRKTGTAFGNPRPPSRTDGRGDVEDIGTYRLEHRLGHAACLPGGYGRETESSAAVRKRREVRCNVASIVPLIIALSVAIIVPCIACCIVASTGLRALPQPRPQPESFTAPVTGPRIACETARSIAPRIEPFIAPFIAGFNAPVIARWN